MTIEELIEMLRSENITGQSDITADSRFAEDLLLNSFSYMLLLVTLEERLHIEADAASISEAKTVRELHEYIERICTEQGKTT